MDAEAQYGHCNVVVLNTRDPQRRGDQINGMRCSRWAVAPKHPPNVVFAPGFPHMAFETMVYVIVGVSAALLAAIQLYRFSLPADERRDFDDEMAHGRRFPEVVCPHCHQKGSVRSQLESVKKGISGAKATGAIMTGGLSTVVTGLSRKEQVTRMHCGHCQMTWAA
jgi:hypothetical protein